MILHKNNNYLSLNGQLSSLDDLDTDERVLRNLIWFIYY